MKAKMMTGIYVTLIAMMIGASSVWAAPKKPGAETPLTQTGQKLLERYTSMLTELRAGISRAVPTVHPQKKAAYLKALQAEKLAKAELEAAQKSLGKVATAQALVAHAKGKWIGGAERGIAQAQAKLKKATTEAEREAAKKELAKWRANREDGIKALKERQEALEKAKLEQPKLIRQFESAKKKLADAKAEAMKATNALGVNAFLASNRLDAKLAKYQIITEATPRGLAEFAQQGRTQQALIEKLLADDYLMIQMALAAGAKGGKYGQAMKIYTDIQRASRKASYGVLQRLALATSLEHAVPIPQSNPAARTDGPATVDPVKRYLHYEKAYLSNELDPGFKDLSVWDYRMVVNGEEPDEILTWGRNMLRNYRPDHISTKDYRWRYVGVVRTDVRYGSQDNKYDKPEQQFFQNILMNGGVCGRRAFFGRFILRAFGIPTTARPQRGHAALAHWTPDGWVVCLGANWGNGWAGGPGVGSSRTPDLVFLTETQARMTGKPFKQVWRARAIGTVLADTDASGFWNSVALYRQRAIIEEAKAVTLAAVGQDIGEANETKEKVEIAQVTMTEADKKISVGTNGVITIPAAACSKPTRSTGKIIFMESNLGGMQLHYSRNGAPQEFEYTFDAPKAGKYALTARVVTPSWKQHLMVRVNGAKEPIDIALPYTVGMWGTTQPVEITLARGKNVLTFSREHEGLKGLTIKDFTLRPIRLASAW